MVSIFALIVIVISLALEIWYVGGIKAPNHTIYVGSYIGASVRLTGELSQLNFIFLTFFQILYGVMLIFPIIDVWVTKSDALFRWPKRSHLIF